MIVGEMMTRKVVTVGMDETLETIREIFASVRFHHLLVVDGGVLYGVISDRDLFKALSPFIGTAAEQDRDEATLHRRAHQIMSRKPVTVGPMTPIREAAELLLTRSISCLPVLDQGKVVGIATWRDLFRRLLEETGRDGVAP